MAIMDTKRSKKVKESFKCEFCGGVPYATKDGKTVCQSHSRGRGRTRENDVYEVKIPIKKNSTEQSAYWDWVQSHGAQDDEGHFLEPQKANPDAFSDEESPWQPREELCEEWDSALSMAKAAMSVLSTREAQVMGRYLNRGMSEEEIAEEMDLSRQAVHTFVQRAEKKIREFVSETADSPRDSEPADEDGEDSNA
jgi:DNA-directed RNA polymerase specialized sigma24 family protein